MAWEIDLFWFRATLSKHITGHIKVGYLAEKLEVCSLSPAALYQQHSCCFFLFHYFYSGDKYLVSYGIFTENV